MDELVINAIYNHVVICSNRNYNSYEVIYILNEYVYVHIQFSSVQSLSRVRLFATP